MTQKGFTLIELLIVIAVLGVLAVGVLTAINVAGTINKANLAKAKTFSASLENALSINQVGKWSFEGTGDDTSGYNNNGSLLNGASIETASNCGLGLGTCLKLDGQNDYVEVLDSNSLDVTEQLTIALWINVKPSTSHYHILGKRPAGCGSGSGFQVAKHSSSNGNKLSFWNGVAEILSNSPISTDRWVLLIITFDTFSDTTKIYIDGKLDSISTSITSFTANSANLIIGESGGCNNGFVNGLMDEVAIYNQTLTAYQIRELYAQGLPRTPVGEAVSITLRQNPFFDVRLNQGLIGNIYCVCFLFNSI